MIAPSLIGGPYSPPAVRRGDRVMCLYRDGDAIVTTWTDAPIPWPRCRAVGSGSGSGLLMSEELARAVRTESAESLRYWFGVGVKAAWNWRKWAGVAGKTTTPGSKLAHDRVSRAGGQAMRERGWSEDERDGIAETSRRIGRRPERWRGCRWTAEHDAQLGTDTDEALAARFGRTESAVRVRRSKLGVPMFDDRRRR